MTAKIFDLEGNLKPSTLGLVVLAIVSMLLLTSGKGAIRDSPTISLAKPGIGELPLSFEKNVGQAEESTRFLAHLRGGTFYFTPSEVVIYLANGQDTRDQASPIYTTDYLAPNLQSPAPGSVVKLQFVGTSLATQIEQGASLPGKVNYLLGNDPAKWFTSIDTYQGITYKELYPGIDLQYAGKTRHLKGTYSIAPLADATAIRWRYSGMESVYVAEGGKLLVTMPSVSTESVGTTITEGAPTAWQEIDGGQVAVSVRYEIAGDGSIGFALGNYDRTQPLVIDPFLTVSTYLGGSSIDVGEDISIDSAGNIYLTGYTESANFPIMNPYQPTNHGGRDAFVAKFDPTGSTLLYSSYLGGSNVDSGLGISVDPAGNAYLTGSTTSLDFPTVNPYQPNRRGTQDAFVAKLNPTGSALIYSTYLGGSIRTPEEAAFNYGNSIAHDAAGNSYIVGATTATDFPIQNPFQATNNGTYDVFVTKLNPSGTALAYSTYLGGANNDEGYDIAVDASGSAYLTGRTNSFSFPTQNPFQPSLAGNFDAFVTKLSSAGSALSYSTYLGGSGGGFQGDAGNGIAIDATGNTYVTGMTDSMDFPTVNAFQANNAGLTDAFLSKFNSSGSALVYSSYLGGTSVEDGRNIAVDAGNNVYLTGSTSSSNFPVLDPIQPYRGSDAFVTKFNSSGSGLVYSTYLGGASDEDSGEGIAVGSGEGTFITGWTCSNSFPTINAVQPGYGGQCDGFLSKISNQSPDTPTPTRTGTPPTATSTPTRTSTATNTPTATATMTSCGLAWNLIDSPNAGTSSALNAVAVVSANDIWAVGWKRLSQFSMGTLVEHWNGTQWSVVTSPVTDESVSLNGVVAIAANDVWAVGLRGSAEGFGFAIHWNGTQWTQVTTPNPSSQLNSLTAITAISASDIWAVGFYRPNADPTKVFTLIERWNGTSWVVVSSPNSAISHNYLTGVTAVNNNPNDIWAVGYTEDGGVHLDQPLAMHWDGTQWGLATMPGVGSVSHLEGVSGVASNDVWAVGYTSPPVTTLIMHWNGTQWTTLPDTTAGMLFEVKAISSNNVWSVGEEYSTGSPRTFVLHWNGITWNQVPSPSRGGNRDVLSGIAVVSPTDIWAVGSNYTGGATSPQQTLTERYYDPCSATPTVGSTSTNTPVTFTATKTRTPTATATATVVASATATACAITFIDVPNDHTFYSFIRCLACRGIISGYSDGTFKPGNEITRSQIAKMVSNAAGLDNDPGGQIFEDVDPSHTFYAWINRLSQLGYMGGYPCGTIPEEQCNPPDNRPYFRPFANATRGQLAKIVSNTAGVGGTPTGLYFTDVPEDHPFYTWIMRLTNLGVMSGYPCGGEGEPCDDQNRPYFRPFANVTRGQASKIVANTFFPGCETPARR